MRPASLRRRILNKIAQTQPTQNEATSPALAPPPAVPGDVYAQLNQGFNAETVNLLKALTNYLNIALYYASDGKDSIQKISNNNMDLSGASPAHKNIGTIAKNIYDTFLNKKNPFTKKIVPASIHQWTSNIINSPEYNNLSQVQPSGNLATKLPGNIKTTILDHINLIKAQNPATP